MSETPLKYDRSPTLSETALERDIRRLESLATLLDSSITVPGTKLKVGVDGLIGLIPGVGDVLGFAPLAYFFTIARRHRLPKRVYAKLAWNQTLDLIIGLIPLLGDLADFLHKANLKNARLLRHALVKQRPA